MDAIFQTLEMTAKVLRDCDQAEADLASYPDDQRRHGLGRLERIRAAASILSDRCLDGIQSRGDDAAFHAAVDGLKRALADEPEPNGEPTEEFFESMYSRLATVLHIAGTELSPEQFSEGLAVLTALANLSDTVRHGGDVEDQIEGFCDFSEAVFDELQRALTGGGDER